MIYRFKGGPMTEQEETAEILAMLGEIPAGLDIAKVLRNALDHKMMLEGLKNESEVIDE